MRARTTRPRAAVRACRSRQRGSSCGTVSDTETASSYPLTQDLPSDHARARYKTAGTTARRLQEYGTNDTGAAAARRPRLPFPRDRSAGFGTPMTSPFVVRESHIGALRSSRAALPCSCGLRAVVPAVCRLQEVAHGISPPYWRSPHAAPHRRPVRPHARRRIDAPGQGLPTDDSATQAGALRGCITRVHRVDAAPITEARDGAVNIVRKRKMQQRGVENRGRRRARSSTADHTD